MSKGGKKKEEKHEVDFSKISEELGDIEHKQHIDQIGPAVTDAYLKHAKFTDEKGVTRYKQKFSKEEAEKLADEVFNALSYHVHRRFFGFDEKQYQALAQVKDPNGNPYIDVHTQYHFALPRREFKRTMGRIAEAGNKITHREIASLLEKHVEHHGDLLEEGVIGKHGLDEPEHMGKVKGAIDKIVDEYKFNKKQFDTSKMYTPKDVLESYKRLAKAAHKQKYGG